MSAGTLRLLIADDDPLIRLTLSATLGSAAGLELVGEAQDAPSAIALAARERPDVVLLDVQMPGGGGVRAAREIRQAVPEAAVLVLSGDDDAATRREMELAGAAGFLVKGAETADMLRVIRTAAGGAR
jgi:DNA-binding NarL/FixJ family response regulator